MSKAYREAEAFIANVENNGRREDALVLLKMMTEATGEHPKVANSAIGFGAYHYRYESGREGDSVLVGFAPRKANMVVYIMPGFGDYTDVLDKLGKFKTGSSCLYLGRLKSVDLDALRELVVRSVATMRERYNVPAPKRPAKAG